MNNANVESKKVLKATQLRHVAGVPVRSGVKAGYLSHREKEKIAAHKILDQREGNRF